jgi:hypothetical protein
MITTTSLFSNLLHTKTHKTMCVFVCRIILMLFLILFNCKISKAIEKKDIYNFWLIKTSGIISISNNRTIDDEKFYNQFIDLYGEINKASELSDTDYNSILARFIQTNISRLKSNENPINANSIHDTYGILSERNIATLINIVNGKTKRRKIQYHFPKNYKSQTTPSCKADVAYSLMQIWNELYWYYPYRDNINLNLDSLLLNEIIPMLETNKPYTQLYLQCIYLLSNSLQDCHSNIWFNGYRPNRKYYAPLIVLETIYDKTIVVASNEEKCPIGSEILFVDTIEINRAKSNIGNYCSCSTFESKELIVNRHLLTTNQTKLNLLIKTPNGISRNVKLDCSSAGYSYSYNYYYNNVNKKNNIDNKSLNNLKPYYKINDSLGYVNLKDLFNKDIRKMIKDFNNCKSIIFDLRCYPNSTMDRLFLNLTRKNESYIYFKKYNPRFYGKYNYKNGKLFVSGILPIFFKQYKGGVIVLINEVTQSQGETMLLAFKSLGNRCITVGSNTAGTNGNITYSELPFGLVFSYSSVGVFNSEMYTYQLNGIPPDILVKKSIDQIIKNGDSVLETAVQYTYREIWNGRP